METKTKGVQGDSVSVHAKQCVQHASSLTVMELNHDCVWGQGGKSYVLTVLLGRFCFGRRKMPNISWRGRFRDENCQQPGSLVF